LFIVLKVNSVMQLSKFQHNFNCFWFIVSRKAAVRFAMKDALATLVNQVRTDGIFCTVERLVIVLLFRQKNYSAVVTWGVRRGIAAVVDCGDDVAPNVWGVIAI